MVDKIFSYFYTIIFGLGFGILMGLVWTQPVTIVKYVTASEARLVGFCNGKYLVRTEEDEFPSVGCMFIEPIHWDRP